MDLKYLFGAILLMTIVGKSSSSSILTLIHDVVQNNIAGPPVVHQHTEWDFHPEQGKERRIKFESLNGRYGEDLIDRLGKGMGYTGSWGIKVSPKEQKPALRYNP